MSGRDPGSKNRPCRIDDARIDNPAFLTNLWKYPCLSRTYSVSTLIKPRIPCLRFLNALSLSCSDGLVRSPLRFDTVIENGNVTAGAGAAAYPVNGVNNDARAGMGGIHEGRWDGRVVLQLHNTRLRCLPGGIAVTDNDFSLTG